MKNLIFIISLVGLFLINPTNCGAYTPKTKQTRSERLKIAKKEYRKIEQRVDGTYVYQKDSVFLSANKRRHIKRQIRNLYVGTKTKKRNFRLAKHIKNGKVLLREVKYYYNVWKTLQKDK